MASKKYMQVSGLVQSLGYSLMIDNGGALKFASSWRYSAETQIDVYGDKNFDYGCKFKVTGASLHNYVTDFTKMYNVQIASNHVALFPCLAAIESWARQELAARAEAEAAQVAKLDAAKKDADASANVTGEIMHVVKLHETIVIGTNTEVGPVLAKGGATLYTAKPAAPRYGDYLDKQGRACWGELPEWTAAHAELPAPTPDDYSHYYGVEAAKSGAERDPSRYPDPEAIDEADLPENIEQEAAYFRRLESWERREEEGRNFPPAGPCYPEESPADRVARRIYSAPTPRRVVEEW